MTILNARSSWLLWLVFFSKLWHPPAWLGRGNISSVVQLACHLLEGLGLCDLSLSHGNTQAMYTQKPGLPGWRTVTSWWHSVQVSGHQLRDMTPRMLLHMLNELWKTMELVSAKAFPCFLEKLHAVSLSELIKLWEDGRVRSVICKGQLRIKLSMPSSHWSFFF